MEVNLPVGYSLERDPEVLLLVAGAGLLVAAFSARGATRGTIEETAWEAYETARPLRKPKLRDPFFHALG